MAISLERLGEHVAAALEHAAPARPSAIDRARRGFLLQGLAARTRSSNLFAPRWARAGGGAIAAMAVTALLMFRRPEPITFAIDGAAGSAKSWLAAPESAALRLEFSEGSNIRLEAGARAKVLALDARGAGLTLETGRVHAEVVSRPNSLWKIEAGPFTVDIASSVFDLNWEPMAQQLVVTVSRGCVSVADSSPGNEQAVCASEMMRTSASTQDFELSHAAP